MISDLEGWAEGMSFHTSTQEQSHTQIYRVFHDLKCTHILKSAPARSIVKLIQQSHWWESFFRTHGGQGIQGAGGTLHLPFIAAHSS